METLSEKVLTDAATILRWQLADLPINLPDYGAVVVGGSVVNALIFAAHGKRLRIKDFDLCVPDPEKRKQCIGFLRSYGVTRVESSVPANEAYQVKDNLRLDFMQEIGPSLADTLGRFDLDACMWAFDGQKVSARHEGASVAVARMVATATRSLSGGRKSKYQAKGFKVVEPFAPVPFGVLPPPDFRYGLSGYREFADWRKATGWEPEPDALGFGGPAKFGWAGF